MTVETRFEIVDDLVGIQALLVGPTGQTVAQLILDTGSVLTTVVPRVAESIGYSRAHMLWPSIKRSAVGERGYIVSCDVSALGFRMLRHPIDVVDLGPGIDGLLGMAFLSQFNFEIRYTEQRIIVEPSMNP